MVNVIPILDEREHVESCDCWCQPHVEWQHPETEQIYANGPVIIHNAADCREMSEQITGESVDEQKKWRVLEG